MRTSALTPGLLDLQNNGSFGADFADATTTQWADALTGLASRGATGLQPTIITAALGELNGAFDRIRGAHQRYADEPVCRVLGAHLEGPFISARRKCSHRPEYMRDPDSAAIDTLLGNPATAEVLLTLTLAPERRHALEAIRRLTGQGVAVSVGHSDATAEQVRAAAEQVWAAADAGATMTTHIFNAQRPLQHREPGVPGVVLADERYFIGMIAAGIDPAIVLASCTEIAARSLRRTDIGHLRPDALADLVWWDEQWRPRRIWVGGTDVAPADGTPGDDPA